MDHFQANRSTPERFTSPGLGTLTPLTRHFPAHWSRADKKGTVLKRSPVTTGIRPPKRQDLPNTLVSSSQNLITGSIQISTKSSEGNEANITACPSPLKEESGGQAERGTDAESGHAGQDTASGSRLKPKPPQGLFPPSTGPSSAPSPAPCLSAKVIQPWGQQEPKPSAVFQARLSPRPGGKCWEMSSIVLRLRLA